MPQPENRKKVLNPKRDSPSSETKKLVLSDTKEIPGKSEISYTHTHTHIHTHTHTHVSVCIKCIYR